MATLLSPSVPVVRHGYRRTLVKLVYFEPKDITAEEEQEEGEPKEHPEVFDF